ncbi:MAG: nucleoside 2-deoxyribosyltransferase [Nitrososphaerota archaeon]|jgi:nucleoside 2-deoxyribosyltransferase|nr:nucleoside 2-deoxyribosyltransferase [Nitrososphaerota archaeon]
MSVNKCPICDGKATVNMIRDVCGDSCYCAACGSFSLERYFLKDSVKDIFASFLFYNNAYLWQNEANNHYFIGSQEAYNKLLKEYPNAKLVTEEDIQAWYPKKFNEKINCILLLLDQLSNYTGDKIQLSYEQMCSMFFVKRDIIKNTQSALNRFEHITKQVSFISGYMETQEFIRVLLFTGLGLEIAIKPEGLKRIDELQKNQSIRKQVFVAMSFDKNMSEVREAIRKGIVQEGYVPRFMDEIEHNKQIVPEMLYEIKQSNFVVAEFTGHNNGVYYEAGYAAGLGKEVIHVCNKGMFKKTGHFDIQQKDTILWEKSEDICNKLCKRIKMITSSAK